MMGNFVQFPTSMALVAKVRSYRMAVDALSGKKGDRLVEGYKTEIRLAVQEDHRDKLLRSVDRYGKRLKPLAPSTLKKPRVDQRPFLNKGMSSRFLTHFVARWVGDVLVAGFRNLTDRKGRPFAQYHLTGAPRARLPRRDVGGITPKGWAALSKITARFLVRLARRR